MTHDDAPAVRLEIDRSVASLVLARPQTRNALNPAVAAEIVAAAERLAEDPRVRVVVLAAEGPHFSAGADLRWMRASLDASLDEDIRETTEFSRMFAAIDALPQAVVACVRGAAIGGGAGLVAAADVVVAAETAVFGFTETRLGIIPAMIGPYVVAKIGYSAARAAFVRARRFDAATALRLGLVHEVVPEDALEDARRAVTAEILENAPGAIAEAKRFLRAIASPPVRADAAELAAHETARAAYAARAIAARRRTDEAQAGIRAFLDRKAAPWAPR